jgi:hypothetical protein
MDVGYDHSEVPKDFHAGFVLVKKDHLVTKKSPQVRWGLDAGLQRLGNSSRAHIYS